MLIKFGLVRNATKYKNGVINLGQVGDAMTYADRIWGDSESLCTELLQTLSRSNWKRIGDAMNLRSYADHIDIWDELEVNSTMLINLEQVADAMKLLKYEHD